MPGTSQLELEFADGTYIFSLKLPQILELQRVCDAGIFEIFGRVMRGRVMLGAESFGLPQEAAARVQDVMETCRLALIGGGRGMVNGEDAGVSDQRARQLVETYLHPPVPLSKAWNLAATILLALVEGYDPPEGQKKSPEKQEGGEGQDGSMTPPSSPTAPA